MERSICDDLMEDHIISCDIDEILQKKNIDNVVFQNTDEALRRVMGIIKESRKQTGLTGLVGDLECVIINTEEERQKPAISELMGNTGLSLCGSFVEPDHRTAVMRRQGSADFIIRSRKGGGNPFLPNNIHPKSQHLPNTRLETFVFGVKDIDRYFEIQNGRGVHFMTEDIVRKDNYSFIQTVPSSYTGNSIGFIQWHQNRGDYISSDDTALEWSFDEPDLPAIRKVGGLDHAATRVHAEHRDPAIIEFMELTEYDFDFAIYVKMMNSITNVARISGGRYAQVFTSGISPFRDLSSSGPTEKFVYNYGKRVHHIAFDTPNIEDAFIELKERAQGFLIDLIGSPKEGLKQTFTVPSKNTLLVNEYIHRYGDFDGFFTRSNVTLLTEATDQQ
ncbi:MAG: hypothetical protein QCI82_04280 [Candidatus Thermoplasmatota archaeon]|nr:hypothetical protein [Candidatus Thermoplasmatota archaeon]